MTGILAPGTAHESRVELSQEKRPMQLLSTVREA